MTTRVERRGTAGVWRSRRATQNAFSLSCVIDVSASGPATALNLEPREAGFPLFAPRKKDTVSGVSLENGGKGAAYFVKCFFFALVSFAEHGDCIWSVGEIVGLLHGEEVSEWLLLTRSVPLCAQPQTLRPIHTSNGNDHSLCLCKLLGQQCLLSEPRIGIRLILCGIGGLTGDDGVGYEANQGKECEPGRKMADVD